MVLFFYTCYCNSQTITGKVIEEISNNAIADVSVLIRELDGDIIKFSYTDELGNFAIEIPNNLNKVFVEISIITHLPQKKEVVLNGNKEHLVNFSLEPRLNALEEVFIKSERKIHVKKDTTIYNIEKFKDGSERVVEDLLKKLPGIAIDENGSIKFKGKQVVRLLLDGGNLFGSNYTIGSKNIDSDIIERVEAIEDYNSNPLLKGIKSSQDVAINLVLKEDKADFSGNAMLGAGIEDKKNVNANLISVSKKIKGFSVLDYNNISENRSPHNYDSNTFSLESLDEIEQRTSNLSLQEYSSSFLPSEKTLLNNSLFGSLNSLFKIKSDLSLRMNYNVLSDKFIKNEKYNSDFIAESENINITTRRNRIKKPLINNFDYELIYNTSKKSILTSTGEIDYKRFTSNSLGTNNSNVFESANKSKDFFVENKFEYTYKVKNKRVLQISGDVSSNNIPQSLISINNSVFLRQNNKFKKNRFEVKSSFLAKSGENEYSASLGYKYQNSKINSSLDGFASNDYLMTNDIDYKLSSLYASLFYSFRLKNWHLRIKSKSILFHSNLQDINRGSENVETSFFTYPSLSINHYFNQKSHIYFDYFVANQQPNDRNLFNGLILVDNRNLINNEFSYNLFNSQSFALGYRVNNFFNLFQFHSYLKVNSKKRGYINELNISEDNSVFTSIVSVTDNSYLRIGLEAEKYINFLKSTINFNSTYSLNEYQNIINNSEVRDNNNVIYEGEFKIRTGFKTRLNFENKMLIRNNNFSNKKTRNSFTSFQNIFNIKYNYKRLGGLLTNQYYHSNLQEKASAILFMDFSLEYKNKKETIEYSVKLNNVFNKNEFNTINSTDFSNSVFTENLQNRFLLGSVRFYF